MDVGGKIAEPWPGGRPLPRAKPLRLRRFAAGLLLYLCIAALSDASDCADGLALASTGVDSLPRASRYARARAWASSRDRVGVGDASAVPSHNEAQAF